MSTPVTVTFTVDSGCSNYAVGRAAIEAYETARFHALDQAKAISAEANFWRARVGLPTLKRDTM